MRDFALVVLAAGRSTRMGSPKALAEFRGRPLIEHVVSPAWLRELGDVVVVLGHHAEVVRPLVTRLGYRHVVNPDPDQGRTGSVQTGLKALGESVRAVFVQPVDCPIVLPQTYAALAGAIGPADVALPSYRGNNGHPPLLSAKIIPQILAAGPDVPLRDLLHAPEVARRCVEVEDPGVLLNIDRPEDLH
jgi:CTP:molybdopterin cytidylyltransferase MocA